MITALSHLLLIIPFMQLGLYIEKRRWMEQGISHRSLHPSFPFQYMSSHRSISRETSVSTHCTQSFKFIPLIFNKMIERFRCKWNCQAQLLHPYQFLMLSQIKGRFFRVWKQKASKKARFKRKEMKCSK